MFAASVDPSTLAVCSVSDNISAHAIFIAVWRGRGEAVISSGCLCGHCGGRGRYGKWWSSGQRRSPGDHPRPTHTHKYTQRESMQRAVYFLRFGGPLSRLRKLRR